MTACYYYFQFLFNKSIFQKISLVSLNMASDGMDILKATWPSCCSTNSKEALKYYAQSILHSVTTFTSVILTQIATCSRLSLSVVELQSKHQARSNANKCRSGPRHKSTEDVRPDPVQHTHIHHR